MTNAINMLPCPMCGCSSINVKNEQPTDNSGGYFIECPDCGISTSLRYACGDDPIPLLAEQWNRRATAQCLHQIAEPQPEALRLAAWLLHRGMSGIKQNDIEASNQLRWLHAESLQHQQELAAYRFTVENREARIAELEAELEAVGAGGVQRLAEAPQAVQAAVPLFWVRLLRDGLYEGPVHNNSVGGKILRAEKPGEWHPLYLHAAPAYPAEGVPAQAATLPPLPAPTAFLVCKGSEVTARAWNVDQMRAYAADALASTQPAAQGLDAQALKQSFREYLSVSEHIDAGGHAMDSIATDLTRIVLAEEEVSAVIARRVHCNTSGQAGEDAANIRAAAQAKQGGAA